MCARWFWSLALTIPSLAFGAALSTPPIVIKGNKFFELTTGNQFFVKGITYSVDHGVVASGTQDILSDAEACKRDIPFLKQLDTNLITVEGVSAQKNHSSCMAAFAAAGIYILPIFSDQKAIWTTDMYSEIMNVTDELSQYDNLFGIHLRTTMSWGPKGTAQGTYALAMARDIKSFIRQRKYRPIPVGASFPMNNEWLNTTAQFLQCTPAEESVDYVSVIDNSFCNNDTYTKSSYPDEYKTFKRYPVPVFFQEYSACMGKGAVRRDMRAVEAMFAPNMTDVFSGGIMFQFFDSKAYGNGIVNITDNGLMTLSQYSMYSSQMARVSPSRTTAGIFSATATRNLSCPTTNTFWLPSPTVLPPTPFDEACTCMMGSLECIYAKPADNSLTCHDPLACTLAGEQGVGNGTFGAWTMCDLEQQASWLLNKRYIDSGRNPASCSFGGSGAVLKPTPAPPNCAKIMSQAGTAGEGTITAKPTFTARAAATASVDTLPTASGLEPEGDAGEQSPPGTAISLSSAAQAGIAIGSIIGAAALVGAVFLLRRCRRTPRGHKSLVHEGWAKAELETTQWRVHEKASWGDRPSVYMTDGRTRSELPGAKPFSELDGDVHSVNLTTREPAELQGNLPAGRA